jgi:hypothetical protein
VPASVQGTLRGSGTTRPAPLGTLHIRAPAPERIRTPSVWFNQTNTGCDRLVSTRSLLTIYFRNEESCQGFYQVILSAL